jgi:epoxide hydrolase-like predicted phosphatase
MTRAILFDLVGVLLFQREDYSPDALVDAVDSLIGRTTDDARLQAEVRDQFHLTGPEFEQVMLRVAGKYAAFSPVWEILPGLRKRYRLGIINNGTWLTFDAFNTRYGLEQNFDLFLSSAREGICKPDERIYRLACERLHVLPEECLFMDDVPQNISGAGQIGMKTIHWPDRQAGFRRFREWLDSEAV